MAKLTTVSLDKAFQKANEKRMNGLMKAFGIRKKRKARKKKGLFGF